MTDQINALAGLARQDGDYTSEQFLQWFLKEQVEEVATMNDLLTVVRRAADNPLLVEEYLARENGIGAAAVGDDPDRAAGGGRLGAAAQDARVVGAPQRHARSVEVLEVSLGELPRRPELVAQAGEGDLALGLHDRLHPPPHLRERVDVRVHRPPEPDDPPGVAQRGEVLGVVRRAPSPAEARARPPEAAPPAPTAAAETSPRSDPLHEVGLTPIVERA